MPGGHRLGRGCDQRCERPPGAGADDVSDDHQLRGRIYTTLARFNVVPRPEAGGGAAEAAMQLLSEEREPELVASALIDRFFAETMLGRRSRRELFERGLELEARAGGRRKAPDPAALVPLHRRLRCRQGSLSPKRTSSTASVVGNPCERTDSGISRSPSSAPGGGRWPSSTSSRAAVRSFWQTREVP